MMISLFMLGMRNPDLDLASHIGHVQESHQFFYVCLFFFSLLFPVNGVSFLLIFIYMFSLFIFDEDSQLQSFQQIEECF